MERLRERSRLRAPEKLACPLAKPFAGIDRREMLDSLNTKSPIREGGISQTGPNHLVAPRGAFAWGIYPDPTRKTIPDGQRRYTTATRAQVTSAGRPLYSLRRGTMGATPPTRWRSLAHLPASPNRSPTCIGSRSRDRPRAPARRCRATRPRSLPASARPARRPAGDTRLGSAAARGAAVEAGDLRGMARIGAAVMPG